MIATFAALMSMQSASASAQYIPRLKTFCLQVDPPSEEWRYGASDSYYEIFPKLDSSTGDVGKKPFSIRYYDTGKVRYFFDSGQSNISRQWENHYVYANGDLLLNAGYNERSNGNDREVGFLSSDMLDKLKSARKVEIRVTERSYGEPDIPRGSISFTPTMLKYLEPVARSVMERLQERKKAGQCI